MARKAKRRSDHRGSFRVIAGRWRGRRLNFLNDGTVRPTPDRIRETVFNWLADDIDELRCIDLFAGSGALGIEALSRGAGSVTFVDSQARVLANIRSNLTLLGSPAQESGNCYQAAAEDFLARESATYDIAFVDPPYGQAMVEPLLVALAPRLAVANRVYVECESSLRLSLPAGWQQLKAKRAGQVGYYLLSYSPDTA